MTRFGSNLEKWFDIFSSCLMEAFRFPNTNDKQLEQREYTVFRKSLFVKYNYHRKQRIFYAKYSNNV